MLPMMKIDLKIIAVMLVSAFLSACGAGVDVASNGDGITGTGITAGRVTGFGSICVNGIKFDVDNADFTRDGDTITPTNQSDFSIGEYIVIKGSVSADRTTGIASEVIFEDLLEGVVTQASNYDGNQDTVEILGQQVMIDRNTVLIDDRKGSPARPVKSLSVCELPDFVPFNLADLTAGNIVEVSGVKDAAGLIKATSIKWKKDKFVEGSENEVKGAVSNLNTVEKTFKLGAILVDYSGASFDGFNEQDLLDGQYVEAKSDTDVVDNTLVATKIKLKDEHLTVVIGSEVEIEGLVTSFTSIQNFDVNGVPVTTNSETVYKGGIASDISEDSEIEVKGKVNNNGVLVAEEIEFED